MTKTPRIAIVGGGPAGLTLARILHAAGFQSTVFERDANPHERPQGGTLDLHEESGLLALERAGLLPEFEAIARYEDQGTRLLNKAGKVLFEDSGEGGDRPEVDRTALRTTLISALPDDSVRWGCTVREVLDQGDGTWHLSFDHGVEGPFDLVVGADGTWSRIRPVLSPYQPQYSGLTFIEFGIDDVDRLHPALSKLVGRGKMSVEADGKAIIAQRNAHAHIRGYAIFRVPTDWIGKHFDLSRPDSMRAALKREFDGFAEDIVDLFAASNEHFAARPIYALPVGHCWANRPGLTLLGDAAHVMSPFGGDGVNNAMLDAAELARLLIERENWAEAVIEFETQMFARTVESAQGAADAAATQLSHDGEALTLEMFRSHSTAHLESAG